MKWIEGYEGRYKISEDGKVWSCKSNKFLKPLNSGGYYRVQLCNGFWVKNYTVHRLVAETYIENPENKLTVNHIDGYKLNNSVGNLEWSTFSENNKHAVITGLHMHLSKKVLQYTLDGKFIREYDSHNEAVKLLSLPARALYGALSGHKSTAYGFIWKFKEE